MNEHFSNCLLMNTFLRLAGFLFVIAALQSADAQPPKVVAHRGLLQHAPENTLANFRACLELRIGFEFDVARTKDGHLVCIHDDTVDRTTDGTGKVSELTIDEIRRLDAGVWFDRRFAGQRVPTVDEIFALLARHNSADVLVAVDLKAADVEADVVRLALRHRVLDRLLFIGRTINNSDVRDRIQAVSPTAQTAVVANAPDEFDVAVASSNASWVYFRYVPPQEQTAAVHKAGKRSFIAGATVAGNLPMNWRKAVDVNMDGILTDHALELVAELRQAN